MPNTSSYLDLTLVKLCDHINTSTPDLSAEHINDCTQVIWEDTSGIQYKGPTSKPLQISSRRASGSSRASNSSPDRSVRKLNDDIATVINPATGKREFYCTVKKDGIPCTHKRVASVHDLWAHIIDDHRVPALESNGTLKHGGFRVVPSLPRLHSTVCDDCHTKLVSGEAKASEHKRVCLRKKYILTHLSGDDSESVMIRKRFKTPTPADSALRASSRGGLNHPAAQSFASSSGVRGRGMAPLHAGFGGRGANFSGREQAGRGGGLSGRGSSGGRGRDKGGRGA